MAAIAFDKLQKHFGQTKAVDGISFEVKEGEIFGYLGQNGAGKTTTISCLMDFLRPTSGSIKIFGKDSQDDSVRIKEQIGYLSDTVSLYDNWSGNEHINYVRRLNGTSDISKKLIKHLDFDAKTKTGKLSTGNRQKLAVILAMMSQPKLLILDEPSTGLDPLMQNTLYDLIEEAATSGTTIFMSSHNLAEVERLSNRVGIIRQGKMVTIEDIEALKQKRLHTVNVTFADEFNKSDFVLDKVDIEEELPNGLVLQVHGSMQGVLAALSKHKLRNLEITRASLESIFLEYYA